MSNRADERGRVYIVDDEANMGRVLQKLLTLEGYAAESFTSPTEALARIRADPPQVLLSDLRMPGLSGEELLENIRAAGIGCEVILMTAYGTVESAMRCVRQGAFDYVTKPFDTKALLFSIAEAMRKARASAGGAPEMKLAAAVATPLAKGDDGLIGESPALRAVRELIHRIAAAQADVLLRGESGTGKEVAARLIHRRSPRSVGPFVAVSCASIPDNLLESELFGHERGAFTGAVDEKIGLVEAANGGTLFLDEIGEMPLALQAKLLRVLQEREITRLGSTTTLPVNIRIIAATNRDLATEVHRGGFRQDLYYRLNVLEVVLPPLRERAGDVRLLAESFLRKAAVEDHRPGLQWTDAALEELGKHDWPGNVRELQNFVRRVAVLATEKTIDRTTVTQLLAGRPGGATPPASGHHPDGDPADDAPGDFREERDRFESEYLRRVLRACAGNVSEAARRAGMSRRHFYEKLEKLDINPDQFK